VRPEPIKLSNFDSELAMRETTIEVVRRRRGKTREVGRKSFF